MIASFFQSLDSHEVRYLLISGQAAVLYGAAVFSEDVDIWVCPEEENCRRLLSALASLNASYYKLTPPLSPANVARGHGFHFLIGRDEDEFYLDVMGCPPRVSAFQEAFDGSRVIATDWGDVPTVGIRDLVEIKKTQRASDYPVISQLVLRYLAERDPPAAGDYKWAAENIFTLAELSYFVRRYPAAVEGPGVEPLFKALASELTCEGLASEGTERAVERLLSERMLEHQARDRYYWREIIGELRDLRRKDQLMPVGSLVECRPA